MTNARTAKSAREKAAELRAEAARAEARRRTMTITAAAAAVIAVIVAGAILIKSASDDQKARTEASQPANLYDSGMLVGNSTAPVTIEIYEDFLCPRCKDAEEANAAQIDTWVTDGKAKVVYKPVSILDDATDPKGYSTRAANAVAAVLNHSPSASPAFHKALFDNQPPEGGPGLDDEKLIELAVAAGADQAVVEPAIREQTYADWVATATDTFSQRFAASGSVGTPTFVVDGTRLESWAPDQVKAAVEGAVPQQ